jgi:hypothetical protein
MVKWAVAEPTMTPHYPSPSQPQLAHPPMCTIYGNDYFDHRNPDAIIDGFHEIPTYDPSDLSEDD